MRFSTRGWARPVIASIVLDAMSALLLCSPAFALDPSLELTQYAHTAWTPRDGLRGEVRSIVQAPDGYLWLGTEFGLVRFDGVRFVPWSPPEDQRLDDTNVRSLLVTHDGAFWIGTGNGLASWSKDKLIQYPELAGAPVTSLLEDHEGTIWVGGSGKLCAVRTGRMECSAEMARDVRPETSRDPKRLIDIQSRPPDVLSLYEDEAHRLWVGSRWGLWLWTPGSPQRILAQPVNTTYALAKADNGLGLLAIAGNVVWHIRGENATKYAFASAPPSVPVGLLRDRNGALWIGTWDEGVLRVYKGKISRFGKGDGLSGNHISTLFEDREGSIWVGTGSGVDRFSEQAVPTISGNQGLSNPVWSVLSARDDSVWIGTQFGLNRWKKGQMTVYRSAEDPLAKIKADASGVQVIADRGLPDSKIGSLLEDRRGRIWVTTARGAAWFENGRFTSIRGLPLGAANAILADSSDGAWISYPASGLFHVVEGHVVESSSWPWSNESGVQVSAIISVPERGGWWVGLRDGRIVNFRDGKIARSFDENDGLGEYTIWNLYIDREGTLWASTEGGLSRLKDGRVVTLTTKNGLPCDAVYWVMEDDAFSLWLYTACGLLRLTQAELRAWVTDPKNAIHPATFDAADGVTTHATDAPYTPVVTKSADGKLWFKEHVEGISVIDPLHPVVNTVPPPVHIEQISANGREYALSKRLELPPRIRDLSIRYTALSFVAPEKIHFRFKLEPQDPDWREVVNIRQVDYSNLSPGNYRFRVLASNNSGVWNEEGDALDFSIAPAYWQTNWFFALCATALVALLWAAYQLRLRQFARAAALAQERRMELAHAYRLASMGQLTASIAHEVNQPLGATVTSALAALRWLKAEPPDLDEIKRSLDRIVQDGHRASDVVSRIRNLVKKAPGERGEVALNDEIAGVLAITRGEALKHEIAVRAELAPDLPVIKGDRVQLQQVLINLIVNAIEAMSTLSDETRELIIRSEPEGAGGVLVTVRDTGPGLAPAVLERIFEPFHTSKKTGLGLGLSISHSIIESHGGRMWASANTPRGAIFHFALPAR